jgi:hypothetical protein
MDANAPNRLKIQVIFNAKAVTENWVEIGQMILELEVGHKVI